VRITFLLPAHGANPVGGFKVVYQYANGLIARGHEVHIVHASLADRRSSAKTRLLGAVKYAAFDLGYKGGYRPGRWFDLDLRVTTSWMSSLTERGIPDADAVIATAWQTAEWAALYPSSKGRRFYLIQHKESLFPDADPERAMATWKLPMHKIVISKWLKEIADEMGQKATQIPNGLDLEGFGLDTPISERDPGRLLMLSHFASWKGTPEGIEAMRLAREEVPEIRADLFGVAGAPRGLPDWIEYHRQPSQEELRALYNRAAIFVSPSWSEGWAMPPAEAMQCGAAACLTDIGGHRDYAIHGETALLSPPRDPKALAENIVRLAKDQELRTGLATRAREFIRRFTWQKAVDSFERCLSENA